MSKISFNHSFEELQTKMNSSLLNKGNTCYINVSLQHFTPMIKLWSNFSLHSDTFSPFVSSFVRIMSKLRSSIGSISIFALFTECCYKSGTCDFNLLQQQDASEIISCILEELYLESPHAQDTLRTTLKNQVSCNNCYVRLSNEESTSTLHLPVTKSIQTALNIFLESEELTESDSCFCNFCASYQPTSMDHQITKVGIYLILELKRFVNHNADFIKDFTKVSSHENFLYHLLLMRLVSTKSLALEPQPTIQEPLIEDNILLLLNSSILHLGFSVMMLPLLDHLWRKQYFYIYLRL